MGSKLLCAILFLTSLPVFAASHTGACIDAFKRNNYELNFGQRLALCEQADSEEGIVALNLVANTHKAITDEALLALIRSRNPYASRCLRAFTSNNYDIAFGRRIFLCGTASQSEALAALEIVTDSKKSVTDEMLTELLAYKSPYGVECLQAFSRANYDPTYGTRVNRCLQATCREGISDLSRVTATRISIEDADLARFLSSRCPASQS